MNKQTVGRKSYLNQRTEANTQTNNYKSITIIKTNKKKKKNKTQSVRNKRQPGEQL